MTTLTQCQQQVLDMLISYQKERGFPPTNQEVATMLGYRSVNAAVFPAMGAGCGQVPFESVARQMKQAWDNFNKKTESINWEYAQSRQSAVFGTYAYCPGTRCMQ